MRSVFLSERLLFYGFMDFYDCSCLLEMSNLKKSPVNCFDNDIWLSSFWHKSFFKREILWGDKKAELWEETEAQEKLFFDNFIMETWITAISEYFIISLPTVKKLPEKIIIKMKNNIHMWQWLADNITLCVGSPQ